LFGSLQATIDRLFDLQAAQQKVIDEQAAEIARLKNELASALASANMTVSIFTQRAGMDKPEIDRANVIDFNRIMPNF
jgi:hypothetical protein